MSDRASDNVGAHVPWDSIGEENAQDQNAPDWEGEAPAEPPGLRDEPRVRAGGWTLPLLCAGLALIACCVLIPQADANRRVAYERQMLRSDLESIEKQIKVNDEFLRKVADDPTLAQRLAERQMKVIPEGTRVLELKHEQEGNSMSPFELVSVAPPPPLPPYKPLGGVIATLCYNPQSRLYVIGASLLMIAVGLVMGYAPDRG